MLFKKVKSFVTAVAFKKAGVSFFSVFFFFCGEFFFRCCCFQIGGNRFTEGQGIAASFCIYPVSSFSATPLGVIAQVH